MVCVCVCVSVGSTLSVSGILHGVWFASVCVCVQEVHGVCQGSFMVYCLCKCVYKKYMVCAQGPSWCVVCVCVQEVHPVLHVSVCHQLQLCLCITHDGLPLRPGQRPLTQRALGEAHGPPPLLSVWLLQQVWEQDWSVSTQCSSLFLWGLFGGGVFLWGLFGGGGGGGGCRNRWEGVDCVLLMEPRLFTVSTDWS